MKVRWRRVGLTIAGMMTVVILGCVLCRWVIIPLFLPGMPGVLHGPFSLEQALSYEWLGPLYGLDAHTAAANLDTTYYYEVDMIERGIYTYFTAEDIVGQVTRVAKMESFINIHTLYKIEISDRKVPIRWSSLEGNVGYSCEIPQDHSGHDSISGPPYQSCLFWENGDGDSFLFYSVWSEAEAVKFVNSLVEVRRRLK